jgi:hypothetical protein
MLTSHAVPATWHDEPRKRSQASTPDAWASLVVGARNAAPTSAPAVMATIVQRQQAPAATTLTSVCRALSPPTTAPGCARRRDDVQSDKGNSASAPQNKTGPQDQPAETAFSRLGDLETFGTELVRIKNEHGIIYISVTDIPSSDIAFGPTGSTEPWCQA